MKCIFINEHIKTLFGHKFENVMLKVNLPAKEKEVPSINVKNV